MKRPHPTTWRFFDADWRAVQRKKYAGVLFIAMVVVFLGYIGVQSHTQSANSAAAARYGRAAYQDAAASKTAAAAARTIARKALIQQTNYHKASAFKQKEILSGEFEIDILLNEVKASQQTTQSAITDHTQTLNLLAKNNLSLNALANEVATVINKLPADSTAITAGQTYISTQLNFIDNCLAQHDINCGSPPQP
jgi:hypothetical protein